MDLYELKQRIMDAITQERTAIERRKTVVNLLAEMESTDAGYAECMQLLNKLNEERINAMHSAADAYAAFDAELAKYEVRM